MEKVPNYYEEVPKWSAEDETKELQHEINPETLESTMTFKDSQDRITRTVRYRTNGTREIQDYDPKTGKAKGAPVIYLPEKTPEALDRKEAVEEALRDLQDRTRDAA